MICKIWHTVPTVYSSLSPGSAVESSFCVTASSRRSFSMALSSAKMEMSRSTSKDSVCPGNAVSPRSASTGIFLVIASIYVCSFLPPQGGRWEKRHYLNCRKSLGFSGSLGLV